jgi:hypothetical protein
MKWVIIAFLFVIGSLSHSQEDGLSESENGTKSGDQFTFDGAWMVQNSKYVKIDSVILQSNSS